MIKRRLLWRFYLPYLFIILLALLAISVYVSKSLEKFYFNQIRNDLSARTKLVAEKISPLLAQNSKAVEDLTKSLSTLSDTRITVILPSGTVIGDSHDDPKLMENHAHRPEVVSAIKTGSGTSIRSSSTVNADLMYYAIPVFENGQLICVVRTAVSVAALDEQIGDLYNKIILAALIVAILSALLSLYFAKRISTPIEVMKETATRFAQGDLDLRVPVGGPLEISELANSLNKMARQLHDRFTTIESQRNELDAIVSSMVEGLIAVDSTGHIVSLNNTAAHLLGVSKENAIKQSIEEITRNTTLQQFIYDTLESPTPTEKELYLETDLTRFFQLHGTSLKNPQGQITGAVIVMNDITKTRRLEKVRSDFVANVSHELKTPVTSIKGFVETLLESDKFEPQETRRFLSIVARHAERLNAIIDDLLALSRLEENAENRCLSFESTKIRGLLETCVEFTNHKASQKNISIVIECPQELTAKINPALMEQAIVNLLDNAIKCSPEHGEIRLITERRDSEIAISVSDKGCGISKKHLERIFERFYVVDKSRSRKLGGTGLGLAIVKHIAHVNGGQVQVESTLGQGSIFTILIPISE